MRQQTNHGFTLIELLVIMVVIGILSTITIGTFSGNREDARIGKNTAECVQIEQCERVRNICNDNGGTNCNNICDTEGLTCDGSLYAGGGGSGSNNGSACTDHAECTSSRCNNQTGTCVPFFTDLGVSCTDENDCQGFCGEGICTNGLWNALCDNDDGDCQSNDCWWRWGGRSRGFFGTCQGSVVPAENGATCTINDECISDSCNNVTGLCVATFTDIGQPCSGRSPGPCQGFCGEIGRDNACTDGQPGDGCDGDGDCRSGDCPTTWGGRSRGHYGFCE